MPFLQEQGGDQQCRGSTTAQGDTEEEVLARYARETETDIHQRTAVEDGQREDVGGQTRDGQTDGAGDLQTKEDIQQGH